MRRVLSFVNWNHVKLRDEWNNFEIMKRICRICSADIQSFQTKLKDRIYNIKISITKEITRRVLQIQ